MKNLNIRATVLTTETLKALEKKAQTAIQFLALHFEQLKSGLEPLQDSDLKQFITLDLYHSDPWAMLRLLSNGIDALRQGTLGTQPISEELIDQLAALYLLQLNRLLRWECCFLKSSYLENGAIALYASSKKSVLYLQLFLEALFENATLENSLLLDVNGLLADDFVIPKVSTVLIGRESLVFRIIEEQEELPPIEFKIPDLPKSKRTFKFKKIDDLYEDSTPEKSNFFNISTLLELSYKEIPLRIKCLVFPLAGILIGLGVLSLFTLFRRPILLSISFLLIFLGLKLLQITALYYNHKPVLKKDYLGAVRQFNTKNKIQLDYYPKVSESWEGSIAQLFKESNALSFEIKDLMQYEEKGLNIGVANIQSNTNSKKKRTNLKSFLYWEMDANYERTIYTNKEAIKHWFLKEMNLDWSQMLNLEHAQLYLDGKALFLLFPFEFKRPDTGQALLHFFIEWLLPDHRVSIEKEPFFLLNSALNSELVCLYGLGIGDPIRGIKVQIVESIHSEGAVGVPTLQKQLRLLQDSNGQLSFKNGTWFNVRAGKVVSIFCSPKFWDKDFDLNAANFATYFGAPTYTTNDKTEDKAARNTYHYYKERNVTLIIPINKGVVSKIAFGYEPRTS